jgi:hypothetical protein
MQIDRVKNKTREVKDKKRKSEVYRHLDLAAPLLTYVSSFAQTFITIHPIIHVMSSPANAQQK